MVHNCVVVGADSLSVTAEIAEESDTTLIRPTFPPGTAPVAFNVEILLLNDSIYVAKANESSLETRVLLGMAN